MAQRAIIGLRLLPEVEWAVLGSSIEDDALCSATLGDQILTVSLADPHCTDTRQLVNTILAVLESLHAREREVDALREQVYCDPLTELWNRRGFQTMLDQALARANRVDEPVSLMLLDIDSFKQINDSLGHAAGDRVLRLVAASITATTRPTDAAGRMGGDELAVLLVGCTAQGAQIVASRFRRLLSQTQRDAGVEQRVTVSIGIADLRALTPEELTLRRRDVLLCAADEAMYKAKRAGRNRVVCHHRCGRADPGVGRIDPDVGKLHLVG